MTAERYPSIKCPLCLMVSYHPEDIKNRYCGKCDMYHDQMDEAHLLLIDDLQTYTSEDKRCWCGGEVGPRDPGDENGKGCLEDIFHIWRK